MFDRARLLGAVLLCAACSDPTSLRDRPTDEHALPVTPKLHVNTSSSGQDVPSSFLVAMDSGEEHAIPARGSLAFPVERSSTHAIHLTGLPDHCNVAGTSTRWTTISTTARSVSMDFGIVCEHRGHVTPVGTQQIVFMRNRDIFAVNADGTNEIRLTNAGTNADPVWSPDGTRVAFRRNRDGSSGATDLYTMNVDGSGLVRHTGAGAQFASIVGRPAWSPDGAKLAYTTMCGTPNRDRHACIVVASADNDGTPALVMGHPRGVNQQAAWSPDGARLAFVSDWAAFDFVMALFVQELSGTHIALLPNSLGSAASYSRLNLNPAWSPDGSKIAYVRSEQLDLFYTRFTVATMNADGSGKQDLAWAGDIQTVDVEDPGSLSWSPDGSRIAFTFFDCDSEDGSQCTGLRSIKYVTVDGKQQDLIVANGQNPSWRR